MRSLWWESLPDKKLMALRLSELEVGLEGSYVEGCLHQLYKSLERKGLVFRPHVWVSDEWFCPDGVPGFAVPFYLLHPRLMELERNLIGEVEGETPDHCQRLMRHEAGHAFDNAYRLRKNLERQEIFGDSKKRYPQSYVPKPYSRSFVVNLDAGYAQSHPDEDFAETFAVWLCPQASWRRKYWDRPAALGKLELMQKLMSTVAKKPPLLQNRFVVDPLHKTRSTLRDYFSQKRRRLGLGKNRVFDRDLDRLFVPALKSSRSIPAAHFIRRMRGELVQEVSRQIGEYQYHVDQVVREMAERAHELDMYLKLPTQRTKRRLVRSVAQCAVQYLDRGYNRIVL